MKNIPIRIMGFEINPVLLEDSIPEAFPAYGLSMTLPYLEPYLIRTMREALKNTSDTAVAEEVKQFIGQEAQHYKQHSILNDILRELSPEMQGIQKIEERLEADYQYFTKNKSLKFNLAYAEGFEAATCAFGRNLIEFDSLKHLKSIEGSDIFKLFQWHMLEEVEHRTVTFNIYKHLYDDYFYRLIIGTYGQYHFFKYMFLFSNYIAKNSPQALAQGKPLKLQAALLNSFGNIIPLLGKLLATYTPWYNPGKLKISPLAGNLSMQLTNEAKEIREF